MQHFAVCGATAGHRGFDGTRVIVLGAMVTGQDRWLMMVVVMMVYCTNHL